MKKLKIIIPPRCLIGVFALLVTGWVARANAQAHVHPAYIQAISHLREARDMLQATYQTPAHQQVAHNAIQEIDAAISDLKQTAALDDKNPAAAAPGDTAIPPGVRFHKAYDLIKEAHALAGGPESDPMALHARESALKHMDAAMAV